MNRLTSMTAAAGAATAILFLTCGQAPTARAAPPEPARAVTASAGAADVAQGAEAPIGSIQRVPTPPVTVPAGTPLQIELASNVGTRTVRVGDRVEGRLARDLVVGDRRAALAGAAVSGTVTEMVPVSDGAETRPALALAFDTLQAANGAAVPVVALYRHDAGADPATLAMQQSTGEIRLRAGTVITATTETTFAIY